MLAALSERDRKLGCGRGEQMRKVVVACVGGLLLWAAGSASAHHSFAMFDRSKETTIVGIFHEVQWF
jgi:hypothetical protein